MSLLMINIISSYAVMSIYMLGLLHGKNERINLIVSILLCVLWPVVIAIVVYAHLKKAISTAKSCILRWKS